jgi:hypothetical protein
MPSSKSNLLVDALNDGSDVDGHNGGSGEINVSVWTDDSMDDVQTRAIRALLASAVDRPQSDISCG